MDARMSSADLVQRRGLGSALRCWMNSSMTAISCFDRLVGAAFDLLFSSNRAKKRSI